VIRCLALLRLSFAEEGVEVTPVLEAARLAKRALGPPIRRWRGSPAELDPAIWGLGEIGGRLVAEGVELAALRARFGSPLHVVLADRLRRNAAAHQDGAAGARPEIFYSYKTNPVPGVLAILHAAGVGAEVISEYELWLALRLGVRPESIVFNGPVKSPASIRTAIEQGIRLLNLNHREEIPVVARAAREAGRRPVVGVRVSTRGGWGGQFGSAIATGEALRAVEEARATGVLDVRAVHSHHGGMIRTAAEAEAHVAQVLAFVDEVRDRLGLVLEILDLGGSLAVPTVTRTRRLDERLNTTFLVDLPVPDPAATIPAARYVAGVMEQVEGHHRARGLPTPAVFLEPGRSLTGDAQVLIASVVSLKEAPREPAWAILDAGMNLTDPMRGEYHHVFAAARLREPAARRYRLAGPICSPGDVLRWSIALPALAPGDPLAIMDAGAYFVPFATSFSFPQPPIVLLDRGETRLLRRAETFEDLVGLDVAGG
jgi:diaminopimelate decarboxylase